MPFGLRNGPAVFQMLMDKVFHGCKKFAKPYIDDVVMFSKSWQDHLAHIDQVLTALGKAGLTINPDKCEWGGRHLLYLGHMVGSGKISVPRVRAKSTASCVRPRTKKGLRSFLGAISYHRKFIPRIAEHTALLMPATSKVAPAAVK